MADTEAGLHPSFLDLSKVTKIEFDRGGRLVDAFGRLREALTQLDGAVSPGFRGLEIDLLASGELLAVFPNKIVDVDVTASRQKDPSKFEKDERQVAIARSQAPFVLSEAKADVHTRDTSNGRRTDIYIEGTSPLWRADGLLRDNWRGNLPDDLRWVREAYYFRLAGDTVAIAQFDESRLTAHDIGRVTLGHV